MKFVKAFLILALAILPVAAQEFKPIRDGVEYAQFARPVRPTEKETAKTATVNALRLDLKKVRLDVFHAKDAAIGVETTSSLARRHNAFAAINAGFFRLDRSIFNGDPLGVLQIDGKLLSESLNDRIALIIDNAPEICSKCKGARNETLVFFEHLQTWNLVLVGKQSFSVLGVNRERKENDLVLFTPEFGITTLTDPNGVEIIIRKGKVVEILQGKGSNKIPPDGCVLSANGKQKELILQKVKMKKEVIFRFSNDVRASDGKEVLKYVSRGEDIVAGVPQLIKNGKIEITWKQEKQTKSFVETRHPRTAVAKLNDGRALLVTVDGRSEQSAGMNLQELAEMLLEMGAIDAMNLDGGGSTTMFLEGKVVNTPSDKDGERPVSDAILVTLRK